MAAWIQLLPALQLFRHKTEGQLSVQGQRWVARNGLMDGDHAGKYLPPGCAPEVLQQLTDSSLRRVAGTLLFQNFSSKLGKIKSFLKK